MCCELAVLTCTNDVAFLVPRNLTGGDDEKLVVTRGFASGEKHPTQMEAEVEQTNLRSWVSQVHHVTQSYCCLTTLSATIPAKAMRWARHMLVVTHSGLEVQVKHKHGLYGHLCCAMLRSDSC